MGTKTRPGQFDCYGALLSDEPFFVLSARDPQAPALVERWAEVREDAINRGERPPSDREKVAEAFALAESMRRWRKANDGAWRTQPTLLDAG